MLIGSLLILWGLHTALLRIEAAQLFARSKHDEYDRKAAEYEVAVCQPQEGAGIPVPDDPSPFVGDEP